MAKANVIGHQNIFTEAMANAGNLVTQALNVANQRRQVENERRANSALRTWAAIEKLVEATPGKNFSLALQNEGIASLFDSYLDDAGVPSGERKAILKGASDGLINIETANEVAELIRRGTEVKGWGEKVLKGLVPNSPSAPAVQSEATPKEPDQGPSEREDRQFEVMGVFKPTSSLETFNREPHEGSLVAHGTARGSRPADEVGIMPIELIPGKTNVYRIRTDPTYGDTIATARAELQTKGVDAFLTSLVAEQSATQPGWEDILRNDLLRGEFFKQMQLVNKDPNWEKNFLSGKRSTITIPLGPPHSFAGALQIVLEEKNKIAAKWLSDVFTSNSQK